MFAKLTNAGLRLITRLMNPATRYLTHGGWKPVLLGVLLTVSALGVGGLLFAWSGLASISASSGHWPATRWFLHFSMHNAVETHSIGIKKPSLVDPASVIKGAGHYATGCMPCHGAPGVSRSLIAQQMTPEPPYLPPRIARWTPEQLFWIVKHGIKATAMPAWASMQRDDEVWAMVAFLQELSTLSPEQYERLAYGGRADDGIAGKAAADFLPPLADPLGPALANCARCHGADGAGRGEGAFPRLSGQSETYLRASLKAYAEGKRNSGIMQPIAAGLSDATRRALAKHYADQKPTGTQEQDLQSALPGNISTDVADSNAIEHGQTIARRGIPEQGIPSCVHCHGPQKDPRNPYYPKLAGQYAGYLALQLTLFKKGQRGGTPYSHIMHAAAKDLSEEQIDGLALYYSSLEQDTGD